MVVDIVPGIVDRSVAINLKLSMSRLPTIPLISIKPVLGILTGSAGPIPVGRKSGRLSGTKIDVRPPAWLAAKTT